MTALALHGAAAAVHDYHTGRAGSFAEALAVLARGDVVEVTTAITRSSYRVLGSVPPLLHAHRVTRWHLTVATFADDAERFVPRLALALPFALHAVAGAARLGITAAIAGAPLCLLGPYADRAAAIAPRVHPAPCQRCAARPRCPGLDETYAARFGAGELTPR